MAEKNTNFTTVHILKQSISSNHTTAKCYSSPTATSVN